MRCSPPRNYPKTNAQKWAQLTVRMQELEVEARAAILAEGEPTITHTDVSTAKAASCAA